MGLTTSKQLLESRVMVRISVVRLSTAAALLLISAGTCFAVDLRLDYRILSNGNTEVDVVSRERGSLNIMGVRVNDSSKATCNLMPVKSDYGVQLSRSDLFTNEALVRFSDQAPATHTTLEFGEFVTAVVPKDCGKVLVFTVDTSSGAATFDF